MFSVVEAGPNLRRNQVRRQRQKAADKLKAILSRHGCYCHWCNEPLVLIRDIPPSVIISKTSNELIWRNKKGIQRRKFATVDHVIPIREGGTNSSENIVPSCETCNRQRTKSKSPKTDEERLTCPKCGGLKPRGRRKCAECRKGTGVGKGRGPGGQFE